MDENMPHNKVKPPLESAGIADGGLSVQESPIRNPQSTIRNSLAWCVILASLFCLSAWGEGEQWLQYRESSEPHRILRNEEGRVLELTSEAGEGLDLPAVSNRARFAKWPTAMVPDGFLWIVLDQAREDGPRDKLWMDSDGNKRISDETPVPCLVEGKRVFFDPVRVLFLGADGSVSYHLNFEVSGETDSPRLTAKSGGWYEGEIRAGGRTRWCELVDHDVNGRFNNKSIDFAQSDLIRIGERGGSDVCLVGDYIEVDKKLYSLEVAPDGANVRLAKAKKVRFGKVRVLDGITELVAGGETGMFTLVPRKGIAKLPVGDYRVYQWTLERKDANGAVWKVQGHSLGNPEILRAAKGKEVKIAAGERIVSRPEAVKEYDARVFSPSVRGAEDETLVLTRNGEPYRGYRVRIRNADGAYDQVFPFSYG